MAKGFLDGYKTYDTNEGYGNAKKWRSGFKERMSKEDAVKILEDQDKSPYEILGVLASDSAATIKKAFRRLITEWHPDLNQHHIQESTEMNKKIIAAYSLLNPAKN